MHAPSFLLGGSARIREQEFWQKPSQTLEKVSSLSLAEVLGLSFYPGRITPFFVHMEVVQDNLYTIQDGDLGMSS